MWIYSYFTYLKQHLQFVFTICDVWLTRSKSILKAKKLDHVEFFLIYTVFDYAELLNTPLWIASSNPNGISF